MIFFYMFIVLSCLPPLYSTTANNNSLSICPESFSCPNLAPFKYPFYNAADNRCGLIEINCTSNSETIQIEGQTYEIAGKSDSRPSVLIYNKTFDEQVKHKPCEALMNNFNFNSSSPLLFTISIAPFINLYKCTNNPNYAAEMDAYFQQPNYNSYNICKDLKFYFRDSVSNATVPNNLPRRCEVIQLPVKAGWQLNLKGPDETNISSFISPYYSFSFQLSPLCDRCHQNGGRCTSNNGQFQCLDTKKEKPGRKLIVSLEGIFITVAIVAVVIILCFIKKLKWRRKTSNDVNVENFLKNHEFLAPKRYSYSEVKKMTNSFKVKLGQGGFGCVYRGELSNGNLVAVKVLSELKGNGEDFVNEVASVGRTCHVNIVTLLGFCCDGHQRALIYEFMPNGSLEKFIYNQDSSSYSQLGWEKLHQIAIGIARGLEYLHSGCTTRILHFDIKPHNILLDQDMCPKISVFGLAKLFLEKRSMVSMSRMRGTPGYIAPELFSRNFGQISHKSDVYSYGMMVLEMVGGRKNVEVEVDHTSEIYFPHWIYKRIEVDEEQLGLRGIMSNEENEVAKKMIVVGLWCIQTNPLSRPTITKVLEMLEGDLASMEIPPKPYLTSPSRSTGSPSIDF